MYFTGTIGVPLSSPAPVHEKKKMLYLFFVSFVASALMFAVCAVLYCARLLVLKATSVINVTYASRVADNEDV